MIPVHLEISVRVLNDEGKTEWAPLIKHVANVGDTLTINDDSGEVVKIIVSRVGNEVQWGDPMWNGDIAGRITSE